MLMWSVILALNRLRQENLEFEGSSLYIVKHRLKKTRAGSVTQWQNHSL